jgi:hypothetical protein
VYQIDKALMKFGMPMGVFRLSDLIGLDVLSHVFQVLSIPFLFCACACAFVSPTRVPVPVQTSDLRQNFLDAFPDRVYRSDLYLRLVKNKRLGIRLTHSFL